MIREINLYKSIKDYYENDLHLKSRINLPQHVWFGSVCPCCGQEQIIKWEWECEWVDTWGSDTSTDISESIMRKLLEEIDDYLRNHFYCVSCGSALLTRPGYLYCSCSDLNNGDFTSYVSEKDFIPYGFVIEEYTPSFSNSPFPCIRFEGYEFGHHYKDASGLDGDDSRLNDDHVYDLNSISSEYLCQTTPLGSSGDVYSEIHYCNNGKVSTGRFTVEQIFEMMKNYRDYDGLYEDDVKSIIQSETDRLEDTVDVEPIRKELSLDQINEVLKEMIGFETLIISLHSRMKRLYLVKERENSKYLNISTQKEENEVENLKKRIQELASERDNVEFAPLDTDKYISKISDTKPKLSYPAKPVAPEEPVYEKPGLLNKKKVEASNEQKKQKYLEDLAKYNNAVLDYNIQVSRLEEIESKRKEEISKDATTLAQQEKQQKLLQINSQLTEAREKMVNVNKALANKKLEIQAVKDNLSELPWNKEFDQAVELLKKTLEAKIVYEKSEVIFPKYHDLVAYTQFYEYFQAGRCTSLTGPDGAYNLYEAELRQNIIIGKLDDISNSLEEIKQNQYMIYSELKSINSNISKLDDSMNKILGKVTEIGTNVEAIRNSTEIMEENSKIAAYYSKKNAELTNAMGYLVALK